jgi:hypothetical protein
MGYRAYEEVAPRNINLNLDTSNIIDGKRQRKACNPDVFAVNFQTTNASITHILDYLYTFSNEVSKPSNSSELLRIHQSQLPLPKHVTGLDKHQYGPQFTEALQKE